MRALILVVIAVIQSANEWHSYIIHTMCKMRALILVVIALIQSANEWLSSQLRTPVLLPLTPTTSKELVLWNENTKYDMIDRIFRTNMHMVHHVHVGNKRPKGPLSLTWERWMHEKIDFGMEQKITTLHHLTLSTLLNLHRTKNKTEAMNEGDAWTMEWTKDIFTTCCVKMVKITWFSDQHFRFFKFK